MKTEAGINFKSQKGGKKQNIPKRVKRNNKDHKLIKAKTNKRAMVQKEWFSRLKRSKLSWLSCLLFYVDICNDGAKARGYNCYSLKNQSSNQILL